MDRSDDLSRSRRFSALELGSGRSRPKIVTSKEERIAPRSQKPANKPPQPSLEFRARQRLRTYAEAATVLDRQAPRDAALARQRSAPERISAATSTPEPAYGDVVPEPPSPMAEAYVGGNPKLTQREAELHNLAPAEELVVAEAEPVSYAEEAPTRAPITSETGAMEPEYVSIEDHYVVEPAPQDGHAIDAMSEHSEAYVEPLESPEIELDQPVAFQTANPHTPHPATDPRARTDADRAKSSTVVGQFTSKSALVAKSLVAKADSMWQNVIKRGQTLISKVPALPNFAAQSGAGVKGRVSRLPANSLLTPQMGSLAASARADASHARPDANVRPVKSEGVLNQEPEPRRTLLARKILDNVERTEARAAVPTGPITQTKRGGMALSSLALIIVTLVLLAAAAWATISIMQRTSTPITTIGETERYRIEAVLEALFIDPGTVDGVIDARTTAAINTYAEEYGYTGPREISAPLLQHLENEAEAMGVLDLIQ